MLGLDRCGFFGSGAAPISKEVLEFFWSLDMPIIEGFGMSETTGIATISMFPKLVKLGCVGCEARFCALLIESLAVYFPRVPQVCLVFQVVPGLVKLDYEKGKHQKEEGSFLLLFVAVALVSCKHFIRSGCPKRFRCCLLFYLLFRGINLVLGHGEICMRGRNIMMGYLNKPEKTAETFDSERYLRSGDLGKFCDAPGDSGMKLLAITGRIKEIIITVRCFFECVRQRVCLTSFAKHA